MLLLSAEIDIFSTIAVMTLHSTPLDPPTPTDAVFLHPKLLDLPHVVVSGTLLLPVLASAWTKDARGPTTPPSRICTVTALPPVSPVRMRRCPVWEILHLLADEGWGWNMRLCCVAMGCRLLYPRGPTLRISLSFPSMLGLISPGSGWRTPLLYTGRTPNDWSFPLNRSSLKPGYQ